jgi:DNA helicase-2/ATP-dependent DNA helicase PcrA
MRARLERLVGPELVRDLWVGTFHSVCARLLRRYHEEVGLRRDFVIYDESDQRALVNRVLKDMSLSDREYPARWVLSRIGAQKQEGRGPEDVGPAELDSTLRRVFERYEEALRTANAVDFDDLLLKVMRIAEDPISAAGRELENRFRHVLVDEFQDTNAVQYRLVRALAARDRNLCVVGDDDQSIYRWRGADVRIIRGFRRDFPDATVVKLEQNYRSTGNIVSAALAVIEPAHTRELKRLWTSAAAGEPVVVRSLDDERAEAAFVMRSVRTELARGVEANDIAVFYRVHAQSRVLEEALRAANIPYQIIGGMKFFERAEVKDLLAYLRLVQNPHSDADLLRVINVPARGLGDKTIDRLSALASDRRISLWDAIEPLLSPHGGLGSAVRGRLSAFVELVSGLREQAQTIAPHVLAGRILEETGYADWLRRQDTAESDARFGNLRELVGSISEYETSLAAEGEAPTLSDYLERVSLVSAIDTMKDIPAVSLMTVHAAKGLEFTTVLLTGMEEDVFPYRGVESDSPEELDEERRLAYVALTRARHRLFISYVGSRTLFGTTRYLGPSRFLLDLPSEGIVHEGSARLDRSRNQFGRRRNDYGGVGNGFAGRALRRPRLEPGQRMVDRDAFDDISPDSSPSGVRPGDRVRHRSFGEGVVESVELSGPVPTVVASFPGLGTRRIKATFLEPR